MGQETNDKKDVEFREFPVALHQPLPPRFRFRDPNPLTIPYIHEMQVRWFLELF